MTLEELQIKFSADTAGLNSELSGVKKSLGGIEAPTGKASGALDLLKKAGMALGGAAIGAKILGIGKDALMMANEVTESESLFEVSMGAMADDARAWSDELSSSLGVNAYSARKNVGVLNTMFKSMGLGTGEAASMSKSLTMLSEDMASFYNLDPTEAFTKLQAGITGEAEGLKRLGILVDEQTVQQYALRKGIIKQGQTMTNAQKVAARYGAILEQTSDAQGDLARTMDSPSNQLRKLNNEFDQAKIALGQALQPALIAVMPVLTGFATGIKNVLNAFSGAGGSGGFSDAMITLDEARQLASQVVGTEFTDIAQNIEKASVQTDNALKDYKRTENMVKQVYLDITLNPPTVTNYELVTTKMDELRGDILALEGSVVKFIDTYLQPLLKSGQITQEAYDKRVERLNKRLQTLKDKTAALEAKVTAKIAAAMEDQEVTPDEKTAILKLITEEVNTATKNMTAVGDAMKAQIAADLKAKKITPEEAAAAVALVDAELDTALANLTATADDLKANVGIGDWNAITLTQEQTDSLAAKITASIESSNVVVKATIDEVKAEFSQTGTIGLVVGTLYEQIGAKITEQNNLIAEKIAGWTSGLKPTEQQVKEVMEAAVERDRLLALMNPDASITGKNAIALMDLTLDSQSIRNYFTALKDAIASETTSAEDTFKKQVARLAVASEMENWDAVLASYGLAGLTYEQAVEALRQQMVDALSEKENKAVIDAAEKLLPSIVKAMEGDDVRVQIKATYDTLDFINSLNLDALGTDAKQALVDMLKSIRIPVNENFTNVFGGANPFQDIIDQLVADINVNGANEAGANFGQGFVNGINSKKRAAALAAMGLASAARGGLRGELQEQSPSKVTRESGMNFGEGFALGAEDMANRVYGTGQLLANEATAGLQGAGGTLNADLTGSVGMGAGNGIGGAIAAGVAQGVQGVMDLLNISLTVDGEQFGRVAVRTVNDAQRRAGQFLLGVGGG